jgi:hypothetical protein
MKMERRTGEVPASGDLKGLLNEAQLSTLGKMERLGWELRFVRRPMHQDTVSVLLHRQSNKVGILEYDGTLNTQPDIKIRRMERSVLIACPNCG